MCLIKLIIKLFSSKPQKADDEIDYKDGMDYLEFDEMNDIFDE